MDNFPYLIEIGHEYKLWQNAVWHVALKRQFTDYSTNFFIDTHTLLSVIYAGVNDLIDKCGGDWQQQLRFFLIGPKPA